MYTKRKERHKIHCLCTTSTSFAFGFSFLKQTGFAGVFVYILINVLTENSTVSKTNRKRERERERVYEVDDDGTDESCSSSPCCIGDEPRGSITGAGSGARLVCWMTTGIETGPVRTAVRFARVGDCCWGCWSVVVVVEKEGYRWIRSRTASSYRSNNWCLLIDTEW